MIDDDGSFVSWYFFLGVSLIVALLQVYSPDVLESTSKLLAFIHEELTGQYRPSLTVLAVGTIATQFVLVAAAFHNDWAYYAVLGLILIACLELFGTGISWYFGLLSSCSISLFGDHPYLIAAQRITQIGAFAVWMLFASRTR